MMDCDDGKRPAPALPQAEASTSKVLRFMVTARDFPFQKFVQPGGDSLWLALDKHNSDDSDRATSIVSAFQSEARLRFSAQGLNPVRVCKDKTAQTIGAVGDLHAVAAGLQARVFMLKKFKTHLHKTHYQCIAHHLLIGSVRGGLQHVERMKNMLRNHAPPQWDDFDHNQAIIKGCVHTGNIGLFDNYLKRDMRQASCYVQALIDDALEADQLLMADHINTRENIARMQWGDRQFMDSMMM